MLFSSQEVETIENLFRQNKYDGDINDSNYFNYIEGKIPVLISAPHTTNHVLKDGNVKLADTYTGSLALLLQRWTNAHIIYLTKQDHRNPNGEEESEYKDAIRKINDKHSLKLVLDIHAASYKHPFDIDFGTSNGLTINKNNLDTIWEVFYTYGILNLTENETFKAPFPTITNYCGTSLGIPSVQLEINKRYRNPSKGFLSFHLLVESLIEIVKLFSK